MPNKKNSHFTTHSFTINDLSLFFDETNHEYYDFELKYEGDITEEVSKAGNTYFKLNGHLLASNESNTSAISHLSISFESLIFNDYGLKKKLEIGSGTLRLRGVTSDRYQYVTI